MVVSATPVARPAIVVSEGSRAYLGYRSRSLATLRLPSGQWVHLRCPAERELAALVLDVRLGRPASAALVVRFGRDWVGRRAQGEFVWPVAAADAWLAAHDPSVAQPAPPKGLRGTHQRVHAIAHQLFAVPLRRAGLTPRPRGGH
jgi:hypothetical protein